MEENLVWELFSYIFQLYESYEIIFRTKILQCITLGVTGKRPQILRHQLGHVCIQRHSMAIQSDSAERKVAGSIPTIGDFHTVGPCKKAVFACLATDVK